MGSKADVNIRFYQPGDDEGIVDLLKKTFPKWGKFDDAVKFWRWKYFGVSQKSVIVVAYSDNKIVGCNHSIVFNAKLGSEITTLSWGDDLAVDTSYRGLGLWPKMTKEKENELSILTKFNYSTASNPDVIKSWAKLHRSLFPFPITRMVKIKDVGLHLRMRPMKNMQLVKYGYIFLKTLKQITNLFWLPFKRSDEFIIVQVSEFDEKINLFWEKIKDDYDFILEKKMDFLNWRFSNTSKGNHVKIQAMIGEEVLGYMVIGLKKDDGYVEGQIEDLLALKNRVDVVDALMSYACKYLDELGVNTVYYQVVEKHPYREISERRGFIDSGSKPYLQLSYIENIPKNAGEIDTPILKHSSPARVYFNYADTV